MPKKILFLFFIALFFVNFSYAQSLGATEVVNYYNDGVKAQEAGNLRDAFTAYQTALLIAPEDPAYRKFIYNNTGVIYARRGDLETARKMFMEALDIDPNYMKANLNLALLYYKRGNKAMAAEYFMKAYNFDIDSLKPTVFIMEGVAGSQD